jgi:hypothetical protein
MTDTKPFLTPRSLRKGSTYRKDNMVLLDKIFEYHMHDYLLSIHPEVTTVLQISSIACFIQDDEEAVYLITARLVNAGSEVKDIQMSLGALQNNYRVVSKERAIEEILNEDSDE